ncbi:DNA recombination protein RecN [Campylobacter sp. MIT 99-7217]|uniref:AAA family ATPase n=1 Tax=Campylobacter sp. MIT 99-7217 TaxID=535091 RepID=UPI00115AA81F|nr:DNA recombination protein RecN [Campylobacter sp. MIT 99-7217]TQR31898.1 DNA recombination protein RecN [Campylobacter sp. MIT 99-7217]
MIRTIFIRENVSFKKAELELEKGLVVFTGLSGAGKSVLFKGILSAFGLCDSEAKFVELVLDDKLDMQEFGIEEDDENVFKMLKEKSAKYFINNQNINKKSLQTLSKSFVKYLSAKENNEFSNERFLNLLDSLEAKKDKNFLDFKLEFEKLFKDFKECENELLKLKEEERKIEELKELATMQIEKISSINPKVGEYEELMSLKKKLSKKDKIEEAWARAGAIFELEKAVIDALNLSEVDSTFFEEALNELRVVAEKQSFDELDFDIEAVLDRIEKLSFIINRYESVENALQILDEKKKELEHYENLSFEKKELEKNFTKFKEKLEEMATKLSQKRKANLSELESLLSSYLKNLYMKDVNLSLSKLDEITNLGQDELVLNINEASLKKLSSGELNRLRLAFIATECFILNEGKGIIFLDEIDANLSGKEAMSIAKVLNELAKFYQIFAISHLPQLSSQAKNHFLVEKINGESRVRRLEKDERIKELARMISGEQISDEAVEFAKTLLEY